VTRLVALLPAHNEEAIIEAAIASLRAQLRPPDEIVVVADNCTDGTAERARGCGVHVWETVDNSQVKAGALNQALHGLLPYLGPHDTVFVMDADGELDAPFLQAAERYLRADATLGAVGGIFRGSSGAGLLGHLQRNEYARYARDVRRLKGKCLVVTGTAALFRASTLQAVSEARLRGALPRGDGQGGVYDVTVLTEDNELTFALKHLGYRVLSPRECTLVTEVMSSWRALWRQRLRWKRGAVENCFQYGITPVTWRYWGRQVFTFMGILVSATYIATILIALVTDSFHIKMFWLGVTGVFMVERAVTVRDRGWKRMLLSALMYELLYDFYLQAVHAKAYADAVFVKTRRW